MNIRELIIGLLFDSEGTTLDFKREQYKFQKASDDEKSELLKDIISFANAWRREDAYILIGVREVKGGKSEVVGITEHLEDANIQQFVNNLVQKAIDFSYKAVEFDGFQLGVIHIPVQRQSRPFYLKKDFGRLKAKTVYLRRGSATDIADIDEISKMGTLIQSKKEDSILIELFLTDNPHGEIQEKILFFELIDSVVPPTVEIPDYGRKQYDVLGLRRIDGLENDDFYRDKAEFIDRSLRCIFLHILVRNFSDFTVNDVKVVLQISESNENEFSVFNEEDRPSRPEKSHLRNFGINKALFEKADLEIVEAGSKFIITGKIGRILAKDSGFTKDRFFIEVYKSCKLEFQAKVFSEDLSRPKEETITIEVNLKEKIFTVDDVINFSE